SQNMSHCTTPRVTTCKAENGGTTVQFVPDYARLGVRDIPGAMRYLRSLAWFLSAVTPRKVAVWLDGAKLPISNLKQFAAALSPTGKCVYDDDSAPAFEVAVIPRVEHPATCMAFVNGIPCHWGTHVTHVVNLFCARLTEILKCKERNVTEALLGRHLTVLINAQVVNPVFKTQTKERLSKNPLGIEWKPQDKFWNALRRSTMLASLADELSGLEQSKVQAQAVKGNSASTRHVDVEKLEDAHEAGNPARAQNTVLILTEGDSAKAMAVNGLSVVGRQYYGVFPLRGKMINACGNRAAACKNEEVIKLLRILGVTLTGQQRRLRYDEIMILTDQDSDGHHCAGLILSFLNEFLPEMLRQNPRFVSRFGTALIKVTGPGSTLVGWPRRHGPT
ncbi:MAG: hypothetical protein EBU07_19075, partial [Betaproteobacteria bacterium]|nr:hypothetical protein [Betaproteobacteria bacterium]